MNLKIKYYFSIILVFIGVFLYSQEKKLVLTPEIPHELPDYYHLKIPGGMEQNSITFIAQDSIGQMWFATKNGVVRYDTEAFHIYKYDANNKRSIGGVFVERVFVGRDGSVWVGTEPGVLSKYHPETDDFETIEGISGKRIKGIQQDKAGLYWITSDKSLYRYNDETKELTSYTYKNKKVGLDRLLITSNNRIFVTTNDFFILEFNPETSRFKKIEIIDKKEVKWGRDTTSYSAFYLTEDLTGKIWITTPLGLIIQYNPKSDQVQKLIFEDLKKMKSLDYNRLTVMFVTCDDEDNIWFGTWFNGLYKLTKDRAVIQRFMPEEKNPNTLSNTIIHSGFQDNAGYLWFGSEFAGINIQKKNKKFRILSYDEKNINSLPNSDISSIVVDDSNKVWVATSFMGVYSFMRDKPFEVTFENKKFGIEGEIWTFSSLYDSKGFVWVGTNRGVYRYHPITQQQKHFVYNKDDYNSLGNDNVFSIVEDKNNNIWFGTPNGISKFDLKKQRFYRFIHEDNNPKSLSHNIVRCLFCDSNNRIWVGTHIGLNLFNPVTGDFTSYLHDYDNVNSISGDRINSIYEEAGRLWIGTQEGGLNEFDEENNSFISYNKTNNFPFEIVNAINSDAHGKLWVSTPHNIIEFNTVTKQFISYGKSDGLENRERVKNMGLQDLEFYSDIAYRDKNDYLYYGGMAGMTFFHPDSIPKNTFKPKVLLQDFLVNGVPTPLNLDNSIVLKSNENNIEVSIKVLNFIQSDKNQMKYFLEHKDATWTIEPAKKQIEYFDLEDGDYILHYAGANNDGVWNENLPPITITILPPFYKTGTFLSIIIVLFVLLGLAFVLYKFYLKKQFEKQRKQLRYSTSNLKEEEATKINKRLLSILEKNKVFLESDLSLHKLAGIINEKPHHLSQVINQIHQCRFHDFINTFRVDEAKKMLIETSLKIEAIAYDSGFNSLSTFNTAFKKETGLTPSKFRKQAKQSS